jgi:hypothetical protein
MKAKKTTSPIKWPGSSCYPFKKIKPTKTKDFRKPFTKKEWEQIDLEVAKIDRYFTRLWVEMTERGEGSRKLSASCRNVSESIIKFWLQLEIEGLKK